MHLSFSPSTTPLAPHSAESAAPLGGLKTIRSLIALALVSTAGCGEVVFRPNSSGPAKTNITVNKPEDHKAELQVLDQKLAELQQKAASTDVLMGLEIEALREKLKTKIDVKDAKQFIRTELAKYADRLKQLDADGDAIAAKMDALMEHLGVERRTDTPPYYDTTSPPKK